MIKLFRNIRQKMLTENKFSKPASPAGRYLIYAIGEIILVVIGILIALSINNKNDARKIRDKELNYLQNLKTDIIVNIHDMDLCLETRDRSIKAAGEILEHFEGKPITDYNKFNSLGINIYNWQKFYQNNNTFLELLNSGNLAIISNDSIKNVLLNIESLYKKMKSEEDHFRFDTEKLIYEPLYAMMDLSPLVNNYEYNLSNGQSGKNIVLGAEHFEKYLNNTMLKNGFLMTIIEFSTMNAQMTEMKQMSENLLGLIDKEIEK